MSNFQYHKCLRQSIVNSCCLNKTFTPQKKKNSFCTENDQPFRRTVLAIEAKF